MSPRILIADDSALLRTALRGLFSGIGDYEIIEAESGAEAVAKVKDSKPNVIILDFAMPAMDGLKVTRVLQRSLPEIPIVMYTMHYTEQLRLAAESAGVRKLISKSETVSLVATVQELLASPEKGAKPATAAVINSKVKVKDLVFDMSDRRTGS